MVALAKATAAYFLGFIHAHNEYKPIYCKLNHKNMHCIVKMSYMSFCGFRKKVGFRKFLDLKIHARARIVGVFIPWCYLKYLENILGFG